MLDLLGESLRSKTTLDEKIQLLPLTDLINKILSLYPSLEKEELLVLLQVDAIGQAEKVFAGFQDKERFFSLLEMLKEMDAFYREMGGIVGYQAKLMQLFKEKKEPRFSLTQFHIPQFLDISQETELVKEAIQWGIEALPRMAEMYALGGAADRLHLVEETTKEQLPAAKLEFARKTLLERLIQDVQAKEHLYYQRYHKQIVIPIAIMTSHEKANHFHILKLFETFSYFGRPKDSIRLFTQPLVPVVDEEGEWCMAGFLRPVMKPGGHGAIWKLARDKKIFDWLTALNKDKCLVRQINNPLAGLDYGLLAFCGIGCQREMDFGFASAPRQVQSAEGVNILVEQGSKMVLTSIEYCDFEKFGIQDLPSEEGGEYSCFPSNTNLLFADLKAISRAIDECPFPGLLVNMKQGGYLTDEEELKEGMMARLESTMQNIADVFEEEKASPLMTKKTYITKNVRHKTISTTKRAYLPQEKVQETPEKCLYDLLFAHRELLQSCGFDLPCARSLQDYLEKGPELFFFYYPALGPLYRDIRKRLQGGRLSLGSELYLDIADFSSKNLCVQGSLQVIATDPLGHLDEKGLLHFSENKGSCIFENVTIQNEGVDWEDSSPFWKGSKVQRKESATIILKGKSRLIARNMTFRGNVNLVVEDGKTLELSN